MHYRFIKDNSWCETWNLIDHEIHESHDHQVTYYSVMPILPERFFPLIPTQAQNNDIHQQPVEITQQFTEWNSSTTRMALNKSA